MRHGEVGIGGHGEVEMRQRRTVGGLVLGEVEQGAPAEEILIRRDVARPARCRGSGGDADVERFADGAGDFILDREDIAELAVDALRPARETGLAIGQAGRDADDIVRSLDRPVEQISHAKLARHRGRAGLAVARLGRTGRGGDPEAVVGGERGAHFLGQPGGEIVLPGIAAQVLERQHRDRLHRRSGGWAETLPPRNQRATPCDQGAGAGTHEHLSPRRAPSTTVRRRSRWRGQGGLSGRNGNGAQDRGNLRRCGIAAPA